MREYYVYILTNASRTFYVGVTNDLIRRLDEHKTGIGSQFTQKYQIHQLVYYESTNSATTAIEREKQIKGWTRAKKVKLIEQMNPEWKDLAAAW